MDNLRKELLKFYPEEIIDLKIKEADKIHTIVSEFTKLNSKEIDFLILTSYYYRRSLDFKDRINHVMGFCFINEQDLNSFNKDLVAEVTDNIKKYNKANNGIPEEFKDENSAYAIATVLTLFYRNNNM